MKDDQKLYDALKEYGHIFHMNDKGLFKLYLDKNDQIQVDVIFYKGKGVHAQVPRFH